MTVEQNGTVVGFLIDSSMAGKWDLTNIPLLLSRILKENMWREFYVEVTGKTKTYEEGEFEKFVTTSPPEGTGTTLNFFRDIIEKDIELLALFDEALQKGPGKKWDSRTVDENIVSIRNNINDRPVVGTTKQYALRKLRKEAKTSPKVQAVLETVIAGQQSPHGAMVELGFRKKSLSIPANPEGAARALRRLFSEDELKQLINLLTE